MQLLRAITFVFVQTDLRDTSDQRKWQKKAALSPSSYPPLGPFKLNLRLCDQTLQYPSGGAWTSRTAGTLGASYLSVFLDAVLESKHHSGAERALL